jgi:hypothetical protein
VIDYDKEKQTAIIEIPYERQMVVKSSIYLHSKYGRFEVERESSLIPSILMPSSRKWEREVIKIISQQK